MQDEQDEKEKQDRRPIDMTTDEAIDYVFAPEIAAELRREAGKCEPEPNDPDEQTV
jgi:hypothetical protein